MSKMKCKRLCVMLTLSLLLVCMMGTTAFAAGTGDDLDAVIDLLHAVLYSGNVLTDRKCGTLASGAADTDGVYAAGDLLLNQGAERVVVDGAALVKGGHNGGTGAGKDGFSHN